jgi:hypothetical protein
MNLFGNSFNGQPGGGGKMWIVYGLVGVLLVLVLLMLAQAQFNVLPRYLDPRPMKWKVESDMLAFWRTPDAGVPLRVDASEFKSTTRFTRYTVLMDMIWYNTRAQGDATQYRHIAHRGSSEVGGLVEASTLRLIEQSGSKATLTGGVTANELTQIGTMPFGLPSRMNPGIMADPVTNDMLIFIDTERGGEFQRESIRVADVPLDTPFYLGILVADSYAEVYINCRLEATKVLRGLPRSVERDWYGLSGPTPLAAQIQNLRYWDNRALTPRELDPMCPALTMRGSVDCTSMTTSSA